MSQPIDTVAAFDAALANGPYAFPGGYPLFFVMGDGEAMSFKAAEAEAPRIREAIASGDAFDRDWRPAALEVNYENADLTCCHTNEPIECAYPPDETPTP